mgnify:CR=1 FL=1
MTLGDKSNHIAMAHVPQIFYFMAFTVFMSPFSLIIYVGKFLIEFVKKHATALLILSALIIPTIALLCYQYSYAHKFLLSDNRHYTFYLMRRLFKIHVSDSVMRQWQAMYAPLYFVCGLILLVHAKGKIITSFCML